MMKRSGTFEENGKISLDILDFKLVRFICFCKSIKSKNLEDM
jgi:hypothetical protein